MKNQDITRGLQELSRAISTVGFAEILMEAALEYEDSAAVIGFAARIITLLEGFEASLGPESRTAAQRVGLTAAINRDRWMNAVAVGLETGDCSRCRNLVVDLGDRIARIRESTTPVSDSAGGSEL